MVWQGSAGDRRPYADNALLNITGHESRPGHPVSGSNWEGFVIEILIAAAPSQTVPLFYRTAAGAGIDLLLEIPGHSRLAIEIKRVPSARPEKRSFIACEDHHRTRRFVVNAGSRHDTLTSGIETIGLQEVAQLLASL